MAAAPGRGLALTSIRRLQSCAQWRVRLTKPHTQKFGYSPSTVCLSGPESAKPIARQDKPHPWTCSPGPGSWELPGMHPCLAGPMFQIHPGGLARNPRLPTRRKARIRHPRNSTRAMRFLVPSTRTGHLANHRAFIRLHPLPKKCVPPPHHMVKRGHRPRHTDFPASNNHHPPDRPGHDDYP